MTPEDVVQPGTPVQCKVIKVDKERSQINLSLKVSQGLLSYHDSGVVAIT